MKFIIDRCVPSDLVDASDEVDSNGKPLNKCFEDKEMYKMYNILMMDSHIDFTQQDGDDVIGYSIDTTNLVRIDPL